MDEVAVRIAEDLHLDVLRFRDVPLEEYLGSSEGDRRLALCLRDFVGKFLGARDDTHASPATAEAGLDD